MTKERSFKYQDFKFYGPNVRICIPSDYKFYFKDKGFKFDEAKCTNCKDHDYKQTKEPHIFMNYFKDHASGPFFWTQGTQSKDPGYQYIRYTRTLKTFKDQRLHFLFTIGTHCNGPG